MQDETIGLVPSFQPVQILLQIIHTIQHINTPTQFCVIQKLIVGLLDPLTQIHFLTQCIIAQ